ncbi:Ankyrin repeat-containing protein BDA1 [Glycine soja]|nr:hypothetical protein JHK86_016362 [Glycine max]
MTLKPSLSQKQNPEGFTPIHLALQHGQERIPLCLVQFNKDLIQLKGRDDFIPLHLASQKEEADDELSYLHLKVGTDVAEDGIPPPLHLASRMGETELLDKFLEVCPDSIEDVNTRSETALHIIAAKHGRYRALKVLFRWLVRNSKEDDRQFIRTTTLNWKDEKGNSILHVAALYNRIKVATKSRAHLVRSFPKRRYMTQEECNAYLVVTTLIATATYQVALSPPGGLYQTHVGTNNTLMSHVAASSSINFKSTTRIEGNSILSSIEFTLFSLMTIYELFYGINYRNFMSNAKDESYLVSTYYIPQQYSTFS